MKHLPNHVDVDPVLLAEINVFNREHGILPSSPRVVWGGYSHPVDGRVYNYLQDLSAFAQQEQLLDLADAMRAERGAKEIVYVDVTRRELAADCAEACEDLVV